MIYQTRKGIVLTTVCGQYVLVAAKRARENCPYITEINETAADCWRKLEQGCSQEQLVSHLTELYEIPDSDLVQKDVSALLQRFLEEGYIIAV